MQSQIYEGKTAAMRTNTTWLASEDIMDAGDVTVTIEAVYKHQNAEFEGGRKEPEIYALKFRGAVKQLVLNSTNRKALVAMFGNHTKNWAGQKVTLYVDHKVKAFGEIRNGIRIRVERNRRPTTARRDETATVETPAGFHDPLHTEPLQSYSVGDDIAADAAREVLEQTPVDAPQDPKAIYLRQLAACRTVAEVDACVADAMNDPDGADIREEGEEKKAAMTFLESQRTPGRKR